MPPELRPLLRLEALRRPGGPGPLEAALLEGWALSQTVYRFDPDAYEHLQGSCFEGMVPLAPLARLPEPSLYVAFPRPRPTGLGLAHGFFARLEAGTLWLLHDLSDWGDLELQAFPLDGEAEAAVRPYRAEALRRAYLSFVASLAPDLSAADIDFDPWEADAAGAALSLLLYRVAAPGDAAEAPAPPGGEGLRLWEVGGRLGGALRRVQEEEPRGLTRRKRKRLRPHERGPLVGRGFWHGRWAGPDHRPVLELRWRPAMRWGLRSLEGLPEVVLRAEGLGGPG